MSIDVGIFGFGYLLNTFKYLYMYLYALLLLTNTPTISKQFTYFGVGSIHAIYPVTLLHIIMNLTKLSFCYHIAHNFIKYFFSNLTEMLHLIVIKIDLQILRIFYECLSFR